MPIESEDVNNGSLITTIPHLLAEYEARKSSLTRSSQDPISFNADNDGLRRYRFIGRVISYDPETAVLTVEDYDHDDGDFASSPPSSTRRIMVNAEVVVFDNARFARTCVVVGHWINVVGRLEVAEDGQLKVRAALIWPCESLHVQNVRRIMRTIMKQRVYRKTN
ncbi:hypothetical protein V1525DRAFT_414471 [Lipomyces kononenkoae]|uniref:Uncharacterized protein n=1 Tax=Lipomyces kononenkoae TaxID=34357 RepID=A0ACC3SRM7_LIPKO